MADQRENESVIGRYVNRSGDYASLDLIESIRQLAKAGFGKKTKLSYDELLFSLRRWWCQHYKRPYKDPLLDNYTFEELLFEYFDIEGPGQDADVTLKQEKIVEEDRKWAEEEEARELAAEEVAWAAANEQAEREAAKEAAIKSDIIKEAEDSDAKWADKYDPKLLVNPTPDQADLGGDISTTFGA